MKTRGGRSLVRGRRLDDQQSEENILIFRSVYRSRSVRANHHNYVLRIFSGKPCVWTPVKTPAAMLRYGNVER